MTNEEKIQNLTDSVLELKNIVKKLVTPKRVLKLYEWLFEWLEVYKKPFVCEKNYNDNFYTINVHIRKTLKDMYLNEVTSSDLQACLNNVESTRTKENVHTVICSAFKKAYENKYILENPAQQLEYKKHIRKQRQPLSAEQQQEYRTKIKSMKLEHLLLYYLLTGARKSEPPLEKWTDVKWNENIILLRGTKTENSKCRALPLYEELRNLLIEIKLEQPSNEYIFPVSITAIQKEVSKLKRKLSFYFSLHMLRHTFITNCVERGVSIKAVQRWAGHSNLTTTEKVYTHISSKFEQEESKKL